MFKEVEVFGELVDFWALPVGGSKSAVFATCLGDYDFAVFFG